MTATSDLLATELRPHHGGSQSDQDDYKVTLAVSLFFKFYLNVHMKLHAGQVDTYLYLLKNHGKVNRRNKSRKLFCYYCSLARLHVEGRLIGIPSIILECC